MAFVVFSTPSVNSDSSSPNLALESKKDETKHLTDRGGRQIKENLFLRGSDHRTVFLTSYWMWKMKPWTGYGLKSFRIKCWDFLTIIRNSIFGTKANLGCSTHSHNYYIELLVETGIVGITLIMAFFVIILKNSFLFCALILNTINISIKVVKVFFIILY